MIQSSFWKKGTQPRLKRGPGDCLTSELLPYSAPLKSESTALRGCKGLYVRLQQDEGDEEKIPWRKSHGMQPHVKCYLSLC